MSLSLASIGVGAAADDGTGDRPRIAGQKINANFAAVAANLEALGAADIDHASVSGNTLTITLKGGGTIAVDVSSFSTLVATTKSGTAYTLTAADNGGLLKFTSATAVTITLPATLPEDFRCECKQMGAGQLIFALGGGATNATPGASNKSPWQYATVLVEVAANSGAAAIYMLGNASA